MGGVDPHKLSTLPSLYKALMDAPLAPLNRGHLPDQDALYVIYESTDPVSVGSPPHLNELELLTASVRIGVKLEIGTAPITPRRKTELLQERTKNVLHARWVTVSDPMQRLMFEVFVSQMLGLAVSHPRLVNAVRKHGERKADQDPISG